MSPHKRTRYTSVQRAAAKRAKLLARAVSHRLSGEWARCFPGYVWRETLYRPGNPAMNKRRITRVLRSLAVGDPDPLHPLNLKLYEKGLIDQTAWWVVIDGEDVPQVLPFAVIAEPLPKE